MTTRKPIPDGLRLQLPRWVTWIRYDLLNIAAEGKMLTPEDTVPRLAREGCKLSRNKAVLASWAMPMVRDGILEAVDDGYRITVEGRTVLDEINQVLAQMEEDRAHG